MRPVAAACALLLGVGAAQAQELSYHGWHGSADYENGQFLGCHLDSLPAAQKDLEAWNYGDSIRVVAETHNFVVIQFMVHFNGPNASLPTVGTKYPVHLATLDHQNMLEDSYNADGDYPVYTLATGLMAKTGEPVVRYQLWIPANAPLIQHLNSARALKVYFPAPDNEPWKASINFHLIDLQHQSLSDPESWLSVFDSNDTYKAIQTVLNCLRDHIR